MSVAVASLLPDALSLPVAAFLLAASMLTSMITASLGVGGGALLLVLMAVWLPPMAIIPVHGLIQLGSNTGRAGLTWRHIDWRVMAAFAPGVLVGAALGAWLLIELPEALWQLTISLFVLYLCWGPALPKKSFGQAGIFFASCVT
ncbi:MAG: TSUP family transporter, partial [Oleiphilaceae bacterium]|nr:TSUP family transporter [Oleiphilaceae bacterium]